MSSNIQENMRKVLKFLYEREKKFKDNIYVEAKEVKNGTGLAEIEVNDAVEILHESGLVERLQTMGTSPYTFNSVLITARGKYEYERLRSIEAAAITSEVKGAEAGPRPFLTESDRRLLAALLQTLQSTKPALPVGSPYGFKDEDWEYVAEKKAQKKILQVVLGCKFQSTHYNTDELKKNVRGMFEQAVSRYNEENKDQDIKVEFIALHAGYGEHLFNTIARDLISSDIAVFETSDLAANVFIEIGVALTWGSRVFPIKKEGCPDPSSDISGQTFAAYKNDAKEFVDPDHQEKLYRMVERAIRRKG